MAIAAIQQLLTMIMLMGIGFLLYKKRFLSTENARGLSVVLTRVAVPANMIVLLQRPFSSEILAGFIKAGAATLLLCALGTVLFYIVGRMIGLSFPELGLFSGGGVYSNVIFMGQPLVLAMFGEEGLIFCVAVMFASNIYLFTACSILFARGCTQPKPILRLLREAFINLLCISGVVGFLFFVFSFSLPGPILDVFRYASNTTVCLSMIVIGSLLASAKLKTVLRDRVIYVFCFLTLIVMPILTKVVAGLFMDGVALAVVVVLMATPAAAALPSFAEQYGNDPKRASELVFVSTIFSVITLPLVARFLCS